MSGFWEAPNDYSPDTGTFNGSASYASADKATEDRADQVHRVAEEVTGKPIPRNQPRRIGFL